MKVFLKILGCLVLAPVAVILILDWFQVYVWVGVNWVHLSHTVTETTGDDASVFAIFSEILSMIGIISVLGFHFASDEKEEVDPNDLNLDESEV